MIGIVTCQQYPQLTPDDLLFAKQLEKAGLSWRPIIWNQSKPSNLRAQHLLIRSPWDYYLSINEFIDWLHDCKKNKIQIINSLETILWNYKKNYLSDLKKFDCAVIETLFFEPSETYESIIAKILTQKWTELVIKPTISASAHLTFKTSLNDPQLKDKIQSIQKFNGIMVQPFIPSIVDEGELSLVFFNNRAKKFSHAVLKTPSSQDFRVQEEFGGKFKNIQPTKTCLEVAERCLQIIPGNWCYARVDLLNWNTKPLVGELELIEPSLYFTYGNQDSVQNFISSLQRSLI